MHLLLAFLFVPALTLANPEMAEEGIYEDLTEDSFEALEPETLPEFRSHFSASCGGFYGGNFFFPKTHVVCMVYGRGARGYEVVYNGATMVAGRLNSYLASQKFSTGNQKVKVGASGRFDVYIVDSFGRRYFVFSGMAVHG